MDSYFASAPAEIRLLIYSHLFTHPKDAAIEIRNAGENRLPPTPTRIRSRYHVLEKQAMLQRRCSYETTYYYHQPQSPLPFHQQQRYLPEPPTAAAVAKAKAGKEEGNDSNNASNDDDEFYICAALMRVSRLVHEETSHLVYAQHAFDFGADMEAVEPFLSDLTPASRGMVRAISLYKHGPVVGYGFDSDRCEWRSVCRYLSKLLPSSSSSSSSSSSDDDGKSQQQQKQVEQLQRQQHQGIRKLRLVIQCGKPPASYRSSSSAAGHAGPPREMSAADFQLLTDIKHESLDWVAELARVGGIEELEIVPHVVPCPPPASTTTILFAALSASVERGLAEFLRKQLRLVD
ncbi:hypothetical protein PG994_006690 [Apiospora phragmitis]|uniref:Uncharacterized protein n=1 Tax=Apiospora phragmitis TaxID=2905665 RepID=A0ABR1VFT4_9PEZI